MLHKNGKTINIFLVLKRWCKGAWRTKYSICKDLFIKQIMPDKFVALGFLIKSFYVSPTHGAQRHKYVNLTNSLYQRFLVYLKICSKCPFKIGEILTKRVKHNGMNCPTIGTR
jgi:hypothetical protein